MIAIILAALAVCLLVSWITIKPQGFPPGPPILPILGCLPFLNKKNFHQTLNKWKNKYGPVVGLKLGHKNSVAVCGAAQVLQVLKGEEFQWRPYLVTLLSINAREGEERRGLMFNDGKSWSQQRRFTFRHLKDLGFGKPIFQTVIFEEIHDFFQTFIEGRNVIQVRGLYTPPSINLIWTLIAGKRFQHGDTKLTTILQVISKAFRNGDITGGPLLAFPFLQFFFPNIGGFADQKKANEVLTVFLKEAIEEHKATKLEEIPRDFIDVFLQEVEKGQKGFTEEDLLAVCTDLFSAGSESVGNTMGFCILYLVLYPDIQEDLFREICEVAGTSRALWEDKPRFHKLEAFISEVFRVNTSVPMGVPRRVVKDSFIDEHKIPRDTFITVSLWSLFQDEKYWENVQQFKPDRFLSSDETFTKNERMIPFGAGTRVCPGEHFARSALFHFLTCLIQDYKLSIPPGHSQPSTQCMPGFTTAPQPFQVAVQKRI